MAGAARLRLCLALYIAAKHGAVGLTRALAAEYRRHDAQRERRLPRLRRHRAGRRSRSPTSAGKTGRREAEARAELARLNPSGRLIAPEEVADGRRLALPPGKPVDERPGDIGQRRLT